MDEARPDAAVRDIERDALGHHGELQQPAAGAVQMDFGGIADGFMQFAADADEGQSAAGGSGRQAEIEIDELPVLPMDHDGTSAPVTDIEASMAQCADSISRNMILEAKQAVLLNSQLAYEEDLELSWRSLAAQMKYAHSLLLKAARNPSSVPELDQMGAAATPGSAGARAAIKGASSGTGASGGVAEPWAESKEDAMAAPASQLGSLDRSLAVPPFARIQRAFDVVPDGAPATAPGMPSSLSPDQAAVVFGEVCERYWALSPPGRQTHQLARAMRQAAQRVANKALTLKEGAAEQYGPAVRRLGLPWHTLAMQLRETGTAGGMPGGLEATGGSTLGSGFGGDGGGLTIGGMSGTGVSSGFGVRVGCFGAAYHSRDVKTRVSLSTFLGVGGVRRLQQIRSDEVQRVLKRERLGAEGMRLANRVREYVVRKMPVADGGRAAGMTAAVVFRGAPLWRQLYMLMRTAEWSSAEDEDVGSLGPWQAAAEVALEHSRQHQGAERANFEALASAIIGHSIVLAGEARAAWTPDGANNIALREACRERAAPPASFQANLPTYTNALQSCRVWFEKMGAEPADDYALDVLAIASGLRPDFDDSDQVKPWHERESADDANNIVWRTLACLCTQDLARHCVEEDRGEEYLTIDWLANEIAYMADLDPEHANPYMYAHLLLLCERFEEAVDYILRHGGGHNGSLAHVHDAVHLAVTLNHYGLLRVADQRVVAFEPPVAPGRVEPPFEGDSPVLLRSDVQDGPGREIAEHSRAEAFEDGGDDDVQPYCACAVRLPRLVEWYLNHVLRLPMVSGVGGQNARRKIMETARQQRRNPRVFTLASTYACFLQEGGIGRPAADAQAEAFAGGASGRGRETALAAQRLRLQGELPSRACQMVVSAVLQLGRAARDALVGGLNEETLMPASVHLADPVKKRIDPAALAGAIREAAQAVRGMGYDTEAIALHCVACDGLGALEVVAESLRRSIEKEAEEHRARRPEDGPGPAARTMSMLTKVAERLLSSSPLSRPEMAGGMAAMHRAMEAGGGAGFGSSASSSSSSSAALGAAGAVEVRELGQRRRALEQLVRAAEAIQAIRGGDAEAGVRQLDQARLLPSLSSGADPWQFFAHVEEEGRRAYGVVLEEAIGAMGTLLRRAAAAGTQESARSKQVREQLLRISSMAHPQLSQYMSTERLSTLARRAASS